MASRASSDVVVRFIGDTGNLDRGLNGLSGRFNAVTTSLRGIATAGAVVGAISFFQGAIKEAEEAERITRKTQAVLKSTGQAAGVTADQVGGLAEKLSDLAGVDDEVIQQGTNVLLTFTKIRNEVGNGNDIFNQASLSALDMAAALDKTGDTGAAYQENVIRIGKALQDPIAGLTALRKVGVNFEAQQREQITTMVQSGDVMGAQKIILAELNKEFGGMSEANSTASGKAAVAWGNFAEAVGARVMPAVNAVGEWLVNTGIPRLDDLADTVGDVVVPAFSGLVSVGREVVGFWQELPGPIQAGAIALGAWMLIGDRFTGLFGRMSGGVKTFGSDVSTAMGAFDVGRAQGTLMALEEHVPVIGRMGQAFRDTAGAGLALSGALPGLQGGMLQLGSVVKGSAAAAVVGLKSAASGLIGFLGGPWGLAFAGAAAALAFFASKSAEANARQEKMFNVGKRVAEIMREQAGATREKNRAEIAAEAAESGMLQRAKAMGISATTMTDAIMGNRDALAEVEEKVRAYDARLEELDGQNTNAIEGVGEFFGVLTDESGVADGFMTDLQGIAAGHADADEKARLQAEAEKGVTDATGKNTEAEQAATDAAKEHKDAVDQLINSLRTYWSESAAAVDSQIAWEEQWDALAVAIAANGTTLDINTEKGRGNATALGALIKTSQDMMAQDLAAQVPMDVATQKHVNRTNALIEEAKRNNLNADEVASLIGQYNGVPPNVTTWLSQRGMSAVQQNMTWLSAIQTLLKDGIEATPQAINARMMKATGYTSSGKEDYAGGRADGGLITGPGTGTSDTAGVFRLSNKEFVQTAAATEYYGVAFMNALNKRRIPRDALPGLAAGGLVAPYPVDASKTFRPSFDQVKSAFLRTHPELNKIGRMQSWAKQQAGKRYLWGAVGPGNYDCSGMVGNLYAMAKGLPMYRRYFTTAGMGPGKHGMAPGKGRFTVYLGPGHTAANVGGLHVEAYGGNGVPVAVGRVGTPLSYYNRTMHLAGLAKGGYVDLKNNPAARLASFAEKGWPEPTKVGGYQNGGWLMPGQLAYNETRKPEAVFNESQLAKMGGENHFHFHGPVGSQQQMENWLTKSLDNLRRTGRLP